MKLAPKINKFPFTSCVYNHSFYVQCVCMRYMYGISERVHVHVA